MSEQAIHDAEQRKAEHASALVEAADMRIQVVIREVNHVLGIGREHVQLAEFGAALVVAALDAVDEAAILTRFIENGKRVVRSELGDSHTPTAGEVETYIPEDLRPAFWRRYVGKYFDESGGLVSPCNHTPAGTVTSHPEPVIDGTSHATTPVCARDECIDEALAWVARMTGKPAHHVRNEGES